MRYKLTFILALLFYITGLAQQNKMDEREFLPKENSFRLLRDSLLKNEIATFYSSDQRVNNNQKVSPSLNDVPLFKCNEESALFSRKGVMVTIEKGKESKGISKIRYLHNNFVINLRDSVFSDIRGVTFCSGSKSKEELSKGMKVYRSADSRRTYIQVLNGTKSKRFSVVWIIKDSKYYGRTVDYLK